MKRSDGMALYDDSRIVRVKISQIAQRASRPRRGAKQDDRALTASIARYGVLQPLILRRDSAGLELISGQRRLSSARAAGLTEVPCVILDVTSPEAELIALAENIQRRNLDFLDEAEGLYRLVALHGFSRQETARRVGISVSALSNKLRLLTLPREVLLKLRERGMTERHARALLRLPREEVLRAAEHIAEERLTVARAEQYVDSLLSGGETVRLPETKVFLLNDVRFFLNTLTRSVEMLHAAGIAAELSREDTPDGIEITVHIPQKCQ